MANRILKYLNKMDLLRDQTDINIDKILKSVDIKFLLNNPEKAIKLISLKIIKDNSNIFKKAQIEGQKLAKSL